jgi:hypothetical protein
MRITIIALIFLCLGCSKSSKIDCRIDENFKRHFDECLRIAELRASYDSLNNEIDLAQSSKAFSCLEALTGVSGNIVKEDVGWGYYKNIEDFEKDKERWLAWFEKYKCSMNMDSAENKFNKKREPLPDYNDPVVMKRILSLWPENYKDSVRQVDSLQRVKYRIDWPSVNL